MFLTGHTGFKGGWLATWLSDMQSEVAGFALAPDTDPSYFVSCGLDGRLRSILGDIRRFEALDAALAAAAPEVVIHMAAQSLVRRSYREPVRTFETNVMGTVLLLEAVRRSPGVRAVVLVTSDKCYRGDAGDRPHGEDDVLGGEDPYGASKACAEIVARGYRAAFLETRRPPLGLATVRAGNAIGGGDWAEDRLVPDAVRALGAGGKFRVRNPGSVRPWQHVLEPLSGYLMLAERLCADPDRWSGAWNFGPADDTSATVAAMADRIVRAWGTGAWEAAPDPNAPPEATALRLDSGKARRDLGWRCRLSLDEAVDWTVGWYREALHRSPPATLFDLSIRQIREYEAR